jgi:integrase
VLLKTVRGDRLEALHVLAITAGLRQSELLGLRWEDVDLEHGTMQVRRTLAGLKNGNPIFGITKTAKGKRSVKLTQKVLEALKRDYEVQLEKRRRLADSGRNTDSSSPPRSAPPSTATTSSPGPSSRCSIVWAFPKSLRHCPLEPQVLELIAYKHHGLHATHLTGTISGI